MWLMYRMTGRACYAREEDRAEKMLDAAFLDFSHLHHDVGFMWRLSSAVSFDLTGDEKSRERAIRAASILAGRFNPLGFIRAWNIGQPGLAIIDTMMNLSLLYWASEKTGDPRFRMIAMAHADTAQQYFVREDGSCNHIVVFDPQTKAVLEVPAGQGYAPGSSWSRGQGWGLYGFMISYRHTGKKEYLKTARRIADYFVSCIGEDGIPNADFRAPKTPVRKDNIAGGLAACGLIDLSEALDGSEGRHYLEWAIRLLRAMEAEDADWTHDTPGIFRRCMAAYGSGIHQYMQYGDFFFIEAVSKLRGETYHMW